MSSLVFPFSSQPYTAHTDPSPSSSTRVKVLFLLRPSAAVPCSSQHPCRILSSRSACTDRSCRYNSIARYTYGASPFFARGFPFGIVPFFQYVTAELPKPSFAATAFGDIPCFLHKETKFFQNIYKLHVFNIYFVQKRTSIIVQHTEIYICVENLLKSIKMWIIIYTEKPRRIAELKRNGEMSPIHFRLIRPSEQIVYAHIQIIRNFVNSIKPRIIPSSLHGGQGINTQLTV